RSRDRIAQRDFFFDVLNVSATRRDAKQYLSHFKCDTQAHSKTVATGNKRSKTTSLNGYAPGINLGSLYAPSAAIGAAPVFHQQHDQQSAVEAGQTASMHAALVSIRSPEDISDLDLDGVALTLSQLVRLGMRIVLVFDCEPKQHSIQHHKQYLENQAGRIARAVREHNPAGARYIDSSLQWLEDAAISGNPAVNSELAVSMPSLIFEPLKRECIPIIPCLAYTPSCQATVAKRSTVMTALTRCLSGLHEPLNQLKESSFAPSLDRIIMIDTLGGIPSADREDGSHVFINMDQEYDNIVAEFSENKGSSGKAETQHRENLTTLRDCLALLPPTSSALVISPEEAASSSRPAGTDSDPASIRTRRQKNPLIHNLLTNRPVISSSLPAARVTPTNGHHAAPSAPSRSTLVKRGMPVTMVPNPRKEEWVPPPSGMSPIALDKNERIHFARLLDLVEDSFRRPLDVKGYLERVRGHIAGVIIAGQYEGGAILTWEAPPGSNNDPNRLVPYLDKFAVLQKAQGNAGVADIVFQAMVRTCFPRGVCWRSRSANPVNKWYFERSVGTWKLPGGYWTMFWTTPNEELILNEKKWKDYVAVCQGVQPTWADDKKAD
ncbi:N-acetylglutamate synthase, partial [Myriangium duriaei CBS 260.36]